MARLLLLRFLLPLGLSCVYSLFRDRGALLGRKFLRPGFPTHASELRYRQKLFAHNESILQARSSEVNAKKILSIV